MISIAHIINPFRPIVDTDLAIAQPITFESMRLAQENTSNEVKVELLSAQFSEDRDYVPKWLRCTRDLKTSSLDIERIEGDRKLPLIMEILNRAYEESEADFIVYTNVDIAIQANFYNRIKEIIDHGHDGFIINRRRIPSHYSNPEELPFMYTERGKSHPGFDCFVFKREWILKFSLDQILVGVPFIGIGMAQNLFHFANHPRVFEKEHLTFHIGEEIFRKRASRTYFVHNRSAFWRAITPMMPTLDSRKWPYGKKGVLERMIRWGLNPSLPIRLALMLEPRRWTRKNSNR